MSSINQEYFDNVNKSIEGCKSCKELQEVIDKQSPAINDLQNSINAQLAILAPMLALESLPAANPTAIVTWISSFITLVILPQIKPNITYATQLAEISNQINNLTNSINVAKLKFPNCNIDNPL